MKQGLFITFEGADGTGKTTQIAKIASGMREQGYEVVCTREPGGTKAAERIRELVLDAELAISHKTETLLYLAARTDHIAQLIKPAHRLVRLSFVTVSVIRLLFTKAAAVVSNLRH